MELIEKLETFRNGGYTTRFHCRKLIIQQDVAQHSFNAALIADHLARLIDDCEINRADVVLHMLTHDLAEQWVGDMPGNIKGRNKVLKDEMEKIEYEWVTKNIPEYMPELYGLNEHEKTLCKFVDRLECCLHTLEELRLHNLNRYVVITFTRTLGALEKVEPTSDKMKEVFHSIVNYLQQQR